ncbi:MAG: ATP-binding cassette domain-containing protein [Deinococcales bacterium]
MLASLKAFAKRHYEYIEAVKSISFDIAQGEIVGFLGSNGAGKTTTLKMLAGLLYPSTGELEVAGFQPQKRQKAFLKSITLVMGQKQQLSWDLAAVDSFLVNQAIYEIPDKLYQERLAELVEMLAIGKVMKQQVRKMSLGERMKCELAAALLHQPKVLFLDEPTIGLDVNMQEVVRHFVQNYNERYGATIMLTSHYMADVTALAKRIIVIEQGNIIFDGNLAKLIEEKAPQKRLKLQVEHPLDEQALQHLAHYGKVIEQQGLEVQLDIPRDKVAGMVAKLLQNFAIADIAISDIPLEAVMGQLFKDTLPAKDEHVSASN